MLLSPFFLRLFLFLLFFLGIASTTFAAGSVKSCQQTWSAGFDKVLKYSIENEKTGVVAFLGQNDISPVDMWASYRPLSLRHFCYLNAICQKATVGVNGKSSPSAKNARGGSIPGPMATCDPEKTYDDIFEEIGLSDFEGCVFDGGTESNDRQDMADLCFQHAEVSAYIFNDMLYRLLWIKNSEKIAGYLAKKTRKMTDHLIKLNNIAQEFSVEMNVVAAQMCTLSNAD